MALGLYAELAFDADLTHSDFTTETCNVASGTELHLSYGSVIPIVEACIPFPAFYGAHS